MNLYQEHILEHYHNPKNWGYLEHSTHQSAVKNSSCGDTLSMDLMLDGEIVKNIAWEGVGCAISLASASLLSEHVRDKSREELLALTPEYILGLLELPLSPGRLKCGILSLEALHTALHSK